MLEVPVVELGEEPTSEALEGGTLEVVLAEAPEGALFGLFAKAVARRSRRQGH